MINIASIASEPKILPIQSRLTSADLWDHFLARLGVRRGEHRVEPGLYALGNPTPDSPVFVWNAEPASSIALPAPSMWKAVWDVPQP